MHLSQNRPGHCSHPPSAKASRAEGRRGYSLLAHSKFIPNRWCSSFGRYMPFRRCSSFSLYRPCCKPLTFPASLQLPPHRPRAYPQQIFFEPGHTQCLCQGIGRVHGASDLPDLEFAFLQCGLHPEGFNLQVSDAANPGSACDSFRSGRIHVDD